MHLSFYIASLRIFKPQNTIELSETIHTFSFLESECLFQLFPIPKILDSNDRTSCSISTTRPPTFFLNKHPIIYCLLLRAYTLSPDTQSLKIKLLNEYLCHGFRSFSLLSKDFEKKVQSSSSLHTSNRQGEESPLQQSV